MTYRDDIWLSPEAGNFATFRALVEQKTNPADWPLAAEIAGNALLYDGEMVRAAAPDRAKREDVMAEWATALAKGPGIIVIRDGVSSDALDAATELFSGMIIAQRATGEGGGDHFAKPGANDRIWNAAEKHCVADPAGFARYYSSDAIAMASEAWLGRGYQLTAQVNRVNPGGSAQTPHRDYHLGFMTPDQMAAYPSHIHGVSPLLTLQGAVAHVDMPLETGPTLYLPYSQLFFEGYLAYGRAEYQAYFAEHHAQLPLTKGDCVFFNPAVMHGAGTNVTKDRERLANLLQVGSAFGRSIESVNRAAMVQALYPTLQNMAGTERANAIAASAEGYAYPTNLDVDLPVGGLAPLTQAQIVEQALADGTEPAVFNALIDASEARRRS